MKPPVPYFGNKRKVAAEVWRRFGHVDRYIEPFFGSGAVLLGRPDSLIHPQDVEIANDLDCLLCNAFRAIKTKPDETAGYVDWPMSEADLVARSNWLAGQRGTLKKRLLRDPDWCCPKTGGWWLWGACCWFGYGFARSTTRKAKLPEMSRPERGIVGRSNLREILISLSTRLSRVQLATGDWRRVLVPATLGRGGTVGIFLDPPYGNADQRTGKIYQGETDDVGAEVCRWALDHGDDPNIRVAVCGYQGEHAFPDSWQMFAWQGHGAYGRGRGTGKAMETRKLERIWFSPGCSAGDKAWWQS